MSTEELKEEILHEIELYHKLNGTSSSRELEDQMGRLQAKGN